MKEELENYLYFQHGIVASKKMIDEIMEIIQSNKQNNMTKEDFQTKRTEIISRMLDDPGENDIYPTGKCYEELDDLFDEIIESNILLSQSKYDLATCLKELKYNRPVKAQDLIDTWIGSLD